MRATTVILLVLSALAGGCDNDCPGGTECAIGPSCQSSCEKLYGEGDGSCNIQIPSKTNGEMLNECIAHCEGAMNVAGEIGDYEPNERAAGDDEVALENEEQAALWMDCVADTSCENLENNYCAPVKNFPR